jgi:FkbH-like protein
MAAAPNTVSLGLLADFNVRNLAVLLQRNARNYKVDCLCAPFGQSVNLLLDTKAEFWSLPHDALVLWTTPERVVPSFNKVLAFEGYSVEDLLQEVDSFVALIERVPDTVPTIFIPNWTAPALGRGWGSLDLTNGIGVANALMRMNIRLAEALEHDHRVVLLNSHQWITAAGAGAYNPKLWYLSKTLFDTAVFTEASRDILAVLDGIHGRSRKVVILDLDNTIWGEMVGEVGWENLQLGGHDPVGEAFVDFQKALKRLVNRGIVLAVVSKGEEAVALKAIDQNPQMILKRDDFVGWRINWYDKAQNIVELLSELNLDLESAVFLDDSAFERARVREALPEVLVPDLPADPMEYPLFLSRLKCFDSPFVSSEDRTRTKMYVADRGRTAMKREIGTLEEWLAMLELNIAVERLSHKNLERAAQLFNKTNQMTLSTRRLSAADLFSWARREGHTLLTFQVRDKFGDYGLCGISSLVLKRHMVQIVDFLLSCRVMGRGVEDAMLAAAMQYARNAGCQTVRAEYIPSAKNQPCRKWLQTLGARVEGNCFTVSLRDEITFPPHIRVAFREADEKVSI